MLRKILLSVGFLIGNFVSFGTVVYAANVGDGVPFGSPVHLFPGQITSIQVLNLHYYNGQDVECTVINSSKSGMPAWVTLSVKQNGSPLAVGGISVGNNTYVPNGGTTLLQPGVNYICDFDDNTNDASNTYFQFESDAPLHSDSLITVKDCYTEPDY